MNCPGGEIGRRTTLRGWHPLGCVSSNLILGTNRKFSKVIPTQITLAGGICPCCKHPVMLVVTYIQ